jgi:DNA-binding beta-propeller fold protein YncE
MDMFGGATRVSFTTDGKTAFISDGLRNRRVVEVDAETGAIRKFWGANGSTPSDAATPAYSPSAAPSAQFSSVTCAEPSKDGMIYVCDRANDRIQVFKLDGSFVKEAKVAPATLGEGSVWDIAFSADAAQRYVYVADGGNHKVRSLDRATLTELANFGIGGRIPGAFYAVGSIAVDSKGNVYTGEAYDGKRVQKFVYGGLAPVTKTNQGVLWPVRAAK